MSKQKGFTLIEMLIAFAIAMFILSVFYLMYGTYQNRLIKVIQKSQGQQAVRLLSTKMRQELKAATGVTNPNAEFGTSDAIKIDLGTYHGYENYSIEYRYEKEKRAIRFIERSGNGVVREGMFLGGNTQILGFFANSNDINQQILTQKHRVDISIEYFDTVQTRKIGNQELVKPQAALITVYPRYTNMLLRIDVPQG